MELQIVQERKTYYYRIIFLITIALIFYFWLAGNKLLFIAIPIIHLFPLVISPTFFYKKKGNVLIELNKMEFYINGEELKSFTIDDKIKIRLFYDGQKSNKWNSKLLLKGFVIRIQLENYEEIHESKLLLKKNEVDQFRNKLEEFYKKGIDIKERDTVGAKYFLFEGNLNYNKIQEIKEKYNFVW